MLHRLTWPRELFSKDEKGNNAGRSYVETLTALADFLKRFVSIENIVKQLTSREKNTRKKRLDRDVVFSQNRKKTKTKMKIQSEISFSCASFLSCASSPFCVRRYLHPRSLQQELWAHRFLLGDDSKKKKHELEVVERWNVFDLHGVVRDFQSVPNHLHIQHLVSVSFQYLDDQGALESHRWWTRSCERTFF